MRLCDWEAAVPRCWRRLIRKHRPGRGGGAVHVDCLQPMRYRALSNTWVCECGGEEPGEAVAARMVAIGMEAA